MLTCNGVPLNLKVDHIYLDMDGVLCDLHYGLLTLHKRLDLLGKIPAYDISPALGMACEDVWAPVIAAGWQFWAELPKLPWTDKLISWALCTRCTTICTRPLNLNRADGADVGDSVRGKMIWLRRHFGSKFTNIVFAFDKTTLSRPGALLIDDDEQYAAGFHAGGGRQLLLPREYNRYAGYANDPLTFVKDSFRRISACI